jgi:hypothetical protein
VLATVPAASPFVVFPWFYWANCCSASGPAVALATPPWIEARPDLVPKERPLGADLLRDITGNPRVRFWGRGFFPSTEDARYAAVYDEALADQVIRLQQLGDGAAALRLAEKLARLAPLGEHDALVLESLRVLRDPAGAREYLDRLPRERRLAPEVNVVLALFARDAGDERAARQFLASVAARFPAGAPLHRMINAPIRGWPRDLPSMIAEPVKPAGQ